MRVDLFDFNLPEASIALRPASPRDAARLLVVEPAPPSSGLSRGSAVRNPADGPDIDTELFVDPRDKPEDDDAKRSGPRLEHRHVRDLPSLLEPGDLLIFNDTKVIPAQLVGMRSRGENVTRVDVTLHMRKSPDSWLAFARPAKRLAVSDRVQFGHDQNACFLGKLDATVLEKGDAGEVLLGFDFSGPTLDEAIHTVGHIPLPPYIASKRGEDERDRTDYQTIYAQEEGAVAAPTAGLHFTPELFAALDARGIERRFVTLHVGAGTFLPVKVDDTVDHKMHAEIGSISEATAAAIEATRARGNRVVAVGTTSLRLLEGAADADGTVKPWSGPTDIFIQPGYRFRAVDALMTNFHLPRSTLFMLVSAFCGLETMQAAYRHAIETGYRFYSYGDSSLLFRADR